MAARTDISCQSFARSVASRYGASTRLYRMKPLVLSFGSAGFGTIASGSGAAESLQTAEVYSCRRFGLLAEAGCCAFGFRLTRTREAFPTPRCPAVAAEADSAARMGGAASGGNTVKEL